MTNSSDRVTGTVYQTSRCRNDHATVGFAHLYVETPAGRQTTDADGWYSAQGVDAVEARLHGLYCRVQNRWREGNGLPQIRYTGPPTFDWNRSLGIGFNDREFRDLMAYYHVTLARQRFGCLLSEPLIEALDSESWLSEMRVIVDETGWWANNAAWDYERHRIRFGANVPFVLDSIVTFHEYAHAITDLITAPSLFPTILDATSADELLAVAVCEGYADYLACSLKDHPKVLECTSDVRHLDQPTVFDPAAAREPYCDSLALSTGLWELRGTLGHSVVDRWIIQSLLDLRTSSREVRTFGLTDAALAAIRADEVINVGANVATIESVFIQRGIL